MREPTQEFKDFLSSRGVLPSDIIPDGIKRRCPTADKPTKDNAEYCLHPESPTGWFNGYVKNYQTQEFETFGCRGENVTTAKSDEELVLLQQAIEAQKADANKKRHEWQMQAASRAQSIWTAGQPAVTHPYLSRKQVDGQGLKVLSGAEILHLHTFEVKKYFPTFAQQTFLIIPLYSIERELVNVQLIAEQKNEKGQDKLFLKNGKKQGAFFVLTPHGTAFADSSTVYLCEGVSTGKSILTVVQTPVVICFDAFNFSHVVPLLQTKFPEKEFILCADNDAFTIVKGKPVNTGIAQATLVSKAHKIRMVVPKFASQEGEPTDFNDLHTREGIETVTRQIMTEEKNTKTTGPKLGKATQLGLFLTSRHSLQYNEFTRSPFVDGKEWDENTLRIFHVESVDANFRGKVFIEDVAVTECLKNSFDPFAHYFTNLSWDGQDHIAKLCSYIHTTADEFFKKALTRWAVQAISKVKQGTQNEVLIMAGAQNIGKSLLVRWICPETLQDYFVECGTVDPTDKDDKIMLCSNFIGEIGEMGSTTLKETRALKDFLTKKEVKVRAPYDRRPIKRRATMSFIGTENPDGAGFLRDVTGARRFNVVDVMDINFDYSQRCNIDQFWAQVYSLYLKKADVSFSVQESNIRTAMISSHTQQSEEVEYLLQYFVFTGDLDDMLYATDILHHMAENGYSRNNRGGAMMIAKALKGCGGIERVRGDRGTEYRGIKTLG